MWPIRLLIVAGIAAVSFAAGGWTVYQRWSVDSLEKTVAQQKRDLEAKQTEIDNERENARRAASLASQRGQDAAAARDRAIEAESKTNDLLAEWTDEAKRAADAARATGLDLARTCPGISAGQWGRLLRDVPIGRAR